MVSWVWIPVSLVAGMLAGMITAAMMKIAKREDEFVKRWWDE